jgi:hypothetical protein
MWTGEPDRCTASEQAESMGSEKNRENGMTEVITPKMVDVVATLDEMHRDTAAAVGFQSRAAVYYVERNHPCFRSWLDMLKQSLDQRRTIVFTETIGMDIRSVEFGDNISGVVNKTFPLYETSVGFTITGYFDVFEIPQNPPPGADWLDIVHKSESQKKRIVFAYDAYHRRVTSLQYAEE